MVFLDFSTTSVILVDGDKRMERAGDIHFGGWQDWDSIVPGRDVEGNVSGSIKADKARSVTLTRSRRRSRPEIFVRCRPDDYSWISNSVPRKLWILERDLWEGTGLSFSFFDCLRVAHALEDSVDGHARIRIRKPLVRFEFAGHDESSSTVLNIYPIPNPGNLAYTAHWHQPS